MNRIFNHHGLVYRIVWQGITRCRLQDNKGRNYIVTYEQIINIQNR